MGETRYEHNTIKYLVDFYKWYEQILASDFRIIKINILILGQTK